ncbi:MAG: pseudouridine synthase [Candidatus Cryptobacteroides sp.]
MEDNRRGGFGRRTEGRREYGRNDSERRGNSERPHRNFGERRSFGDRPARNFGDKKNFNDRNESGERRSFGDRPARSYSDRPARSFGERPARKFGDKPARNFGDKPARSFGERPAKSYGDKPARTYGDRPYRNDSDRHSFGDRRKPFAGKGNRNATGRKKAYGDLNYFRNEDESGISRMINRRPQLDSNSFSDNDMVITPIKEEVRLNKFIANSGICSRREADNFILAGVVTVNGEVVTELGTKININNDDVRFNGERLKGEAKVYIVMNKPKGYVTTSSDPHADKTVMDLLKKCPSRVFPVGRLDKNTTGVLMFTNDGEIAEKLTHPSYDKKKIYQVSLDNKLKQEDFDKIMSGVELSDGVIAADALEYIEEDDHRKLGIEIHSGKNRIVRRIFESLGYEVKALDRVYFAGLTKKGIKRGDWRYLTEGEINLLKMGAYL